ncbi:CHAT domain-containing protein [Kribbella sp. CA-253562]|uniref:CHAT domain-containing protein n=1 Tax=Kribbella sp. CA-253562 TaxID=3239942 RepID=UPI003D91F07A
MAVRTLLSDAERLHQSYELHGNVVELNAAVSAFEEAIVIADEPDTRSAALNGLGTALWSKAERSGRLVELEQAIEAFREAATTAQTSTNVEFVEGAGPAFQANLAGALRFRWRLTRSEQDLAESIAAARAALAETSPTDQRRSNRLSNLAEGLLSRYLQLGDSSALAEAVKVSEQALVAARRRSEQRAFAGSNLAEALRLQYLSSRTRDLAVLDRAIELARATLAATPPDRRLHPRFQSNLAVLLVTRYHATRSPADLAEATTRAESAVAATPPGHPNRVERLSVLTGIRQAQVIQESGLLKADLRHTAGALANRPDQPSPSAARRLARRLGLSRRDRRLQQLVAATAEAVAAVPDGYRRSEALLAHGAALAFKHEADDDRRAGVQALTVLQQLATDPAAAVHSRIQAATLAAFSILAQSNNSDVAGAAESLRRAVELLPQTAPRRLPYADREHQLAGFSGLAGHAAACEIALGRPHRAVELLETGRGVLLGQALDARTEVTELHERHPDLAARFEELRSALDRPEAAGFSAAETEAASGAPQSERPLPGEVRPPLAGEDRHALADEWDELLVSIHRLPGFAEFLRPPQIDELLTVAAGEGPVVLVNTSMLRCDALVLTDGEVRLVELPQLRFADLTDRAEQFRSAVLRARSTGLSDDVQQAANETIQETLAWLWDVVTQPVLESLDLLGPSTDAVLDGTSAPGPLPRLWWIPTGPLTTLPLHAAGLDGQPGVLDLVRSSYAATVRSLIDARRTQRIDTPPAPLIVSVAAAPGTPVLPHVREEATALSRRFPAGQLLADDEATRQRVLEALPQHRWVHFACHAVSAADGAGTGQLLLHDHQVDPLTVVDIARLRLVDAEIAYLSACDTSVSRGDLADEALHVTGAFQMAGFRHVIGTLWAVGDQTARMVADGYYSAVLADPGNGPATALHTAVRAVRAAHPATPAVWAPFVHAGA